MRLVLPLLLSLFTSSLALKGASVRNVPSSLARRRAQDAGAQGARPKESDEVATLTDKKASPKKDPEAGLVSKDKADKTKDDKSKKDKTDKKGKKEKEKKCKKAKKKTKRRSLQADMAPVQPPNMAPDSTPGASPMSPPDAMALPNANDATVEELPYCLHGEETARVCEALKQGKPPKKSKKKVDGDLSLEITHDVDKSSEEVAEKVGKILRSETPIKFLGCTGRRRLFLGNDKEGDDMEEVEAGEEEEESLSVVGLDFGTLTAQECGSRGFLSGSGSENCGQVVSDVEIFFDGKNKPTEEEKADMFDLLIATVESLAAEGAFDEVGTVQKVGSSASSSGSGGATVPIVAAVVAAAAVIGGGAFLYKRQQATKNKRSTGKGGETDESDDEVVEAHVIMVEDEEYKGKDKKKKYQK